MALDVADLETPVRRVLAARTSDPHVIDDVVQETLARILGARHRLDDDALLPYAITVARNVLADHGRESARRLRSLHRLHDPAEPAAPDVVLVRREEESAMREALRKAPDRDRAALVDHEVHGSSLAVLAEGAGTTPGAVAARLARTRARLRVDYLLALRGVDLPTARCRPVLMSLSTGDRRRQRAEDSAGHLVTCATCRGLSEPLVERRSVLAGVGPLAALAALWPLVRDRVAEHPVASAGVATATVAAAVTTAVLLAGGGDPERPVAAPPPSVPSPSVAPPSVAPVAPPVPPVSVGGVALGTAAGLTAGEGTPARLDGAVVAAVPADEGFWVELPRPGAAPERVWVQLSGAGESGPDITPGRRVSGAGTVVRHAPGFAAAAGVTAEEGAAALDAAGAHIAVDRAALQVAG